MAFSVLVCTPLYIYIIHNTKESPRSGMHTIYWDSHKEMHNLCLLIHAKDRRHNIIQTPADI